MPRTNKRDRTATPVIILLGGPGSGKGTHGLALAAALGFDHLSTGQHFREHIQLATPLGKKAREFIAKGQLVPDSVTNELVHSMLSGTANGFVLDGYPRAVAQAQELEEIARVLGCVVTEALYLAISDTEIMRRLSGRLTCRACGRTQHDSSISGSRVCSKCSGELYRRTDDEPSTIRRRIAVFHKSIEPLLAFYAESGRLTEIFAEGVVTEVSGRVIAGAKRERSR